MTDFAELANQVAGLLKPFLLAAGGKLAEGAVAAGREQAAKLYQWLKEKFTKTAAAGALDDVAEHPEDETNWEVLILQIRKALEKDEVFRQELLSLLPAELRASSTHQSQTAAGNHIIQIESSGTGGKIQVNKPSQ